jgi:hypothetical protein
MSSPEKGTASRIRQGEPRQAVIGLESEFTLFVQDEKRRPEHVFRNPQNIVRELMIPRTGRSYHLPSGGAIYFDTGVIEVATPIIEFERGSAVRAARSLWEQIEFTREELDAWESRHRRRVRLEGFSTHYNISVLPERGLAEAQVKQLALLLSYILPIPTMILAANRLSTGVGVRPRGTRIEITADFTPDPDLMTATASLVFGIVSAVMAWPRFNLGQLRERGIPVIAGFKPRKHTSRKGWLARFDCFPRNPFTADLNEPDWLLRDGRRMSLRQIAMEISAPFRSKIRPISDRACVEHLFAVLDGRARSLLDFKERPPRYEDVGRVVDWNRRSMRALPRSRYEKVIHKIITGRRIKVDGKVYIPVRMQGWYEVLFRNAHTGLRRVFNLDDLVKHCAV